MIEVVSEPLLEDARLWETYKLHVLCAGHAVHLLPDRIEKQSQVLWSGGSQASQPHPILVGKPPLGVWPSRAGYHCFPMLSSL